MRTLRSGRGVITSLILATLMFRWIRVAGVVPTSARTCALRVSANFSKSAIWLLTLDKWSRVSTIGLDTLISVSVVVVVLVVVLIVVLIFCPLWTLVVLFGGAI